MNIVGNLYRIKDFLFFELIDDGDLNHLFIPIMIWDGKKINNEIAIVETISKEDYDYDYDDNLVYNGLIEHNTYHLISYNPYDGKPFNFLIKNVYNKTNEYNDIINQEKEWNEKRRSKQKSDMIYKLCNDKQNLISCCPIFYKNKNGIYHDYEKINWIEII